MVIAVPAFSIPFAVAVWSPDRRDRHRRRDHDLVPAIRRLAGAANGHAQCCRCPTREVGPLEREGRS
jgi:hypothetical protein